MTSSNRLSNATSPYLQQHAANPVDWWPWCDEALELARREDRPILLSIGYSACHWCHVMAHESFEDPAIAAVMNELCVNIKVDREERPDLDKIYQSAHQLLTQRPGGWPLTVCLTPDDQSPFFAGTYFPPRARHGLPAFGDLLRQVTRAYHEQGEAIRRQNSSLRNALRQLDAGGEAPGELEAAPIQVALRQLAAQYDARDGGFGGAPKFPHPGILRFLLREGTRSQDATTRQMALYTLEQIAEGGINDHLGGGFYRYSVDEYWMIPHFEKMLYDNGQLLALYAEAWAAADRRPSFARACQHIAEWLMREMQSPQGGYYASLDADSQDGEGRFYLWTPTEVADALAAQELAVFTQRFGLDRTANFEGRWHLHGYSDTTAIADRSGLASDEIERLLASARNKLLMLRNRRVPPGRDEKILTSWNALAIKGMAAAGRRLDRPDWINSAEQALRYLYQHHWRNGRLLVGSRDGSAQLNAYLDDYAYLLDAILELLQARWDSRWLDFASRLAACITEHFEDPDSGGFFFTSDDHEVLVHRPRALSDDATPSGNAIAIEALFNLSALSGEPAWRTAAERALRAGWGALRAAPEAHVGLLEGLRHYLDPPEQLLLRGEAADLAAWQAAAEANYAPGRSVFAIPTQATELPTALAAKRAEPGRTLAYRCHASRCEAPFDGIGRL